MIDLHCHILHGIDDGAKTMEESISMAQIAAADGITKIVATPHIRENIYPVTLLETMVETLNQHLQSRNIPVEVIVGGDVFALLPTEDIGRYSIGNSPYVLVEFPYTYIPATAGEILFRLVLQGLKPIITHPERNPSVIQNPDVLLALLGGDVYVQITADSLVGRFGRDEQSCAIHLLRNKAVHFIASDAHSDTFRLPKLSEGLHVAEKIIGRKEASKLVMDNPNAVLAGEQIDTA